MLEWPKRDNAIRVMYLSATCKLAKIGYGNPDLEPYVFMSSLKAYEPRQGHGTELMRQICDTADYYGDIVCLTVGRYGRKRQMTNSELIIFYQKFGFKVMDDELPVQMERIPNAKERTTV